MDIEGNRFVAEVAPANDTIAPDVSDPLMAGNEFVTLQDVAPGQRSWVKRSGIPYGAGGQSVNSGAGSSDLIFFPGTKRYKNASNVVDNSVYYSYDSASSGTLYAQWDESSSGTALKTGWSSATQAFYDVTAVDDMVFVGAYTYSHVLSGCVFADYTGTATFSAGSPTVSSISSTLSAAQQLQMVGGFLINTSDSGATQAVYRIKSVDSSSQVTLDRNFGGSGTGAGQNVLITSAYNPRGTVGVYQSTNSALDPHYVRTAWGRLVMDATSLVDHLGSTSYTRLVWTGAIGSNDGTSPFTGMWALDPNGYVDLDTDGGYITGIVPFGDAVVVFQQKKMTIIYGTPEFDDIGSLDLSTRYDFRNPSTIGFYETTPYGLFYLDKVRGLCLWDGSGQPKSVSRGRANKVITDNGLTDVSYFGETIIVYATSSSADWLLYHVPTDSFSTMDNSTALNLFRLQSGRGTIDALAAGEELFVACLTGGAKVIDLGYALSYPYAAQVDDDYDDTTINFKVETPSFVPLDMLVRPERVFVTYRTSETTDTNPWLKLTLNTGPKKTSFAADHTWSSVASDLPDTAGDYVTKEFDVSSISRAAQLKVTLESQNKAKEFEVVRVVVTGTAEGIGGS